MASAVVVSLDVAKKYLQHLDLDYIIEAMCAESYPLPRWTKADAKKCAELYKNFLYLQKKHSPEALVPTREIDEFWHNHILFTKKYTEDCLQIFGYYLHHEPAQAGENPEELVDDFLRTKQYYFDEFREELLS